MKRSLSLLMAGLFAVLAAPSFAYDCYTDCGDAASFKYPCPTVSNPGRKCKGRDPVVYSACESAKFTACQVLEPLKDGIIKNMAAAIANNGEVQREAKGWTTASCLTTGAGLITAVNAAYATPICAAFSVAAAGCATFVLSSGGVIVGATCTQLCTDKHLADCQ